MILETYSEKDTIKKIVNPELEKTYLADPRQFNISEFNVRMFGGSDSLERISESVLNEGFLRPIDIDVDTYTVVNGSRRLLVALKYKLMIPTIFKKYASDKQKVVHSFVDNDGLPLSEKNIGLAVRKMDKLGMGITETAKSFGRSVSYLAGMVQESDKALNEEATESKKKFKKETFSPGMKEVFDTVEKSINPDSDPGKSSVILNTLQKLDKKEQKQILEDTKKGIKVDLKGRAEVFSKEHVDVNVVFTKEEFTNYSKACSRRDLDLAKVIRILLKKWMDGDIELTSEDYKR